MRPPGKKAEWARRTWDLYVCSLHVCRADAGLRPRGPSPRPSENATSIWNAISIWIGTETLQGEMLPAGTLPTGTLPVGTLPTGTLPVGTLPTGTLPVGTLPTGTLPTGTLPVGTLPTGTLPGPFFRLRLFGSAEDLSLLFSEDGSSS